MSRRYLFFIFLCLFISISILIALFYKNIVFTSAIFETGDFASNALKIGKAKYLSELYGNYSRWGFQHPGPAFFYVYAIGEYLFFDTGLLASPHQAHIFSGIFLQTFFFSVAIIVLTKHAGKFSYLLIATPILIFHLYLVRGSFASIWPPNVLLCPIFLLIISSAAVFIGHGHYLVFSTLTACFLIHGHVAQPLFVFPIYVISYIGLFINLKRGDYPWYAKTFGHFKKTHMVSFVIIVIFISPILLDMIKGHSSNFSRILGHLYNHSGDRKTLSQAICYFFSFLSYEAYPELSLNAKAFSFISFLKEHILSISIWFSTVIFTFVCLMKVKKNESVSYFRSLFFFYCIALVLTLKWGTMQNSEMYAFNGFLNYAIIPIPWLILVLVTINYIPRNFYKNLLWIIPVITIVYISNQPSPFLLSNNNDGIIVERNIRKILKENFKKNDVILLDFEHSLWPDVITVSLAITRQEYQFYVNPNWGFIFGHERNIHNAPFISSNSLKILNFKRNENKYQIKLKENFGVTLKQLNIIDFVSDGFIDFSNKGNTKDFLISGFSDPYRDTVAWSVGKKSSIIFGSVQSKSDVEIALKAFPYTGDGKVVQQFVNIYLNSLLLGTGIWEKSKIIRYKVPKQVWNANLSKKLEFVFPNAISPKSLGLSADYRDLALGFVWIRFKEI